MSSNFKNEHTVRWSWLVRNGPFQGAKSTPHAVEQKKIEEKEKLRKQQKAPHIN